MRSSKSLLIFGLCILLSGLLALPVTGFAKEDHGGKYKELRAQMMKNLNLSAGQDKKIKALADEFLKQRMDLYGQLQKNIADLEQAMAAKPVNDQQVQEKVNTITAVKDKLWANYQDWWHGEMKVLKPQQQARYLLDMNKWWKEVMAGHCAKEMGAQPGQEKKSVPEPKPEKK
jgi:Spy/CpxP family protein refolding chaperone